MGDDGRSGQMGLNCPSSGTNTSALSEKVVAGLAMNSAPMFKAASHEGGECFYSSGWDPIASLTHSENFGTSSMVAHAMFASPSYPIASETRGSHLMHYPSDPNVVEMVPKLGGGSFSEMVSPFGMPGYGQNYAGICPEKYASSKNIATEEYCPRPEERGLVASPSGKRKRVSDPSSPLGPSKTAEGDPDRDLSGETSEPKESDEKKQRIERNGKEVRDSSQGGEATKDDYIHVRARRGQATNSHSLAERVRREKISQRMRLLQELVPGCNKITGKAVMLDEIINYVQSLQQQVEFLSMKLATVNPELNFDLDRILSKDILHLRGGGAPLLGFNPGTSSSHPFPQGIHQGTLPGISNASAYPSLPQSIWDGEMQGLFHMGYDSNPSAANLGPNEIGDKILVKSIQRRS